MSTIPTPDPSNSRPSLLPALAVIEARLIANAREKKTLNALWKLAVAEAKANGTYAGDEGRVEGEQDAKATPLFPEPEPDTHALPRKGAANP